MARQARARIGLFVAGGTYAYQTEIMAGAHEECQRRGFDLICLAGGSLGWPDPRSYCYRIASPDDLDAAILVPGTWGAAIDSRPVLELLEPYLRIPSCLIGARHGDVPSVCIDNEGGVAEVTRHLIEVHGRRRIAFIAGRGTEAEERQHGYERALREAGLEPDPQLFFPGDFSLEAGLAAAARWCNGGQLRCDAIVAANDWMASGALELLHDENVRVPEDVSLIGFDDIDRASFMSPPLTTIRQPPHFLGREAVKLVAALLQGDVQQRHVAVPTQPQIRRSCGCFGHGSSLRAIEVGAAGGLPTLADSRVRIAVQMAAHAASLVDGLPEGWAEQLVVALASDLRGVGESSFMEHLLRYMASSAQRGNITAWYHVVSRLREQAIPRLLGDTDVLTRAEAIFGRAYIAIGERAELAQAQRLLEREDMILRLEDTSREARTALDWPALCRVLTEHLPRFKIPRFYVATGNSGAAGESRQVYAFDADRELPLPDGGSAFSTGSIIAEEVRPSERMSLLVHALFMREEILGHCVMELGPKDGALLKTLGEVISSSLKATQLSEALVAEVLRRERAERERMHQELAIAARIQTAILPKHTSVPGLELSTIMLPASEVGGDYFDVLPCTDGCWLGIGDVAGHGLPAGLVMLMIQSIVAATVHERPTLGPGQAWLALNRVLTDNIRERMGQDEHATLSLLRYHGDGRVSLAGAHEDLMIYRAASRQVECVATPGIWVGIMTEVALEASEELELELSPGDVLLLYTDGVLNARAASGALYGCERLQASLALIGHQSVQAIRDAILRDLMSWMDNQDDDITLVVLRHTGPRPPATHH
jgi:DNA-binding LacI/PurR family transcriptional regulator/serine phosphatase RsbU (regulator of sigma subunit)